MGVRFGEVWMRRFSDTPADRLTDRQTDGQTHRSNCSRYSGPFGSGFRCDSLSVIVPG